MESIITNNCMLDVDIIVEIVMLSDHLLFAVDLYAGFLLLCDFLYRDLILPVAFMQIMHFELILPAPFCAS
jgi:hypothetical protein